MNISELDQKAYNEAHTNPNSAFNVSLNSVLSNQAEWASFEDVDVLRVGNSDFIAVPATGRKNAANFIVININDRSEAVCQLKKNEVRGWLCKKALA